MKNVIDNETPRSDYETPVIKIFSFTTENILLLSEPGESSQGDGSRPDTNDDWIF